MFHIVYAVLLIFFLGLPLMGQDLSAPLMKDTSFIYKGQPRSALFFGTDIGEKVLLQHWKLFLKEKFKTSLKPDFKNKTSSYFKTREILSANYFDASPTLLHVAVIQIKKDSLVWILFADKEAFTEKWQSLADDFLISKLPVMYHLVFDVLKKGCAFFRKGIG